MFSLAHGFDETPIKIGFNLVTIRCWGGFYWFVGRNELDTVVRLCHNPIGCYLLQSIKFILSINWWSEKKMDIWAKSMIFGFGSLILSVIIGIVYLFGADVNWLHLSIWF